MMQINEIYSYNGKTISRYEWNRIREGLGQRFTHSMNLDYQSNIMHVVLRQEAKIINTRLVPLPNTMKFTFSIFVIWNDLYKRKLLLINRKINKHRKLC